MTPEEAGRLLDRAQQISDLTRHPGWPHLVEFVEEMAHLKSKYILAGSCEDAETYKRMVGWLEGAAFALNAAEKSESAARHARGFINRGA